MLRSLIVATLSGGLVAASAAAQTPAPLYRVFLTDGAALASFGEWTQVGDRVVFSMPLRPDAGPGELHLVSMPTQRIDLPRTQRYAESVRAAHYATTRGEADFAQLSTGVAQALNQIATLPEPRQRLAVAEQARRTLAAWPAAHHGYRAGDVREFLALLDDAIAALRAQSGQQFDIALASPTVEPPAETLLPTPDQAELAHQLNTAAHHVESPAERVSLLQSVIALLDRAVDLLPAALSSTLRASALNTIEDERRTDEQYAALRSTTLADAEGRVARADVRGVDALRVVARDRDAQLGSRRPGHMAGLLAALDSHLDAARRLRLAQDQWLLSEAALREYRRAVSPRVQGLLAHRTSLEDIKLMAGPAPQRLLPLARELERHARWLALLDPPPSAIDAHAAFRSAFALAENAVQLRRDAIRTADVDLAQRASAAAAGSVMLLERARADLRTALEPPLTRVGREP